MKKRDDFSESVKRDIGARVNYLCSYPTCNATTLGPQANHAQSINVGVAAHITAASPGGPRYNAAMSPGERRSPANGIWLCQTHAKMIDSDLSTYGADTIRGWKAKKEQDLRSCLGVPGAGPSKVHSSILEEHRLDKAVQALRQKGEIRTFLDTLDLSSEEKASLYDKAYLRHRGRTKEKNPYRNDG